jgi:C1A family cysteine protease
MTVTPHDQRRNRYGLGRLLHIDDRDRAFPMAAVLATDEAVFPKRTEPWQTGPVLHQGETSSCTGHAAAAWLMAEPVMTLDGPDPFQIYTDAQTRDPWAATPHDGSTVRAAMQALQDRGHIRTYLWAHDTDTIADWILRRGTVVAGLNWYRGMFTPSEEHVIRVRGPAIGGHAVHLVWYDEFRGMFRVQNSWGSGWGDGGFAWIDADDVQRLLNEDGEACAPTEQSLQKDDHADKKKERRRRRR